MDLGATLTERPRDVYLAACAEIAQTLVPAGFRYLRSKSRIVRREADLRYEILFSSSSRNYIVPLEQRDSLAEGLLSYGDRHQIKLTTEVVQDLVQGSVVLSLRASVHSTELEQWRRSQTAPLRRDDHVVDSEIGLLRSPPSLATFNLAPRTTRQQSIVEAAALAHEVALPFFDLFRRPDELVQRLLNEDLPGFWEAPTFDYVLCFGGRRLGLDLLRRRLDAERGLWARFEELLPFFQTEDWRKLEARQRVQGIPLGGHQELAGRLATIAAAYQLHPDEDPIG